MEKPTSNTSLPRDWAFRHRCLQGKVTAVWWLGGSTECDNIRWGYEVVLDGNNHQLNSLGAYEPLKTLTTPKVSAYAAYVVGNTCATNLNWK